MKQYLFTLAATCLLACNNHTAEKTSTEEPTQKDSTVNTQGFFPITDFIAGEMRVIDSLQLPLSKSVTINKVTKQFAVTDAEFKWFAKNFLQPDINDPALRTHYTESSIADQSVPSIALTYTTTDQSLPVKKINVFIKPDPVSNDKVSAIFIEKAYNNGDTAISQKLYWKAGRNMQVTTEKVFRGKALPVEQVKIIWDPTE
jgi:hypothetical protein